MNKAYSLALSNLLLLITFSASGQDKFEISANIGLTSDYKYYGSSFSNEEWATIRTQFAAQIERHNLHTPSN